MTQINQLKDILEEYHANYDEMDTEKTAQDIIRLVNGTLQLMICPSADVKCHVTSCYHYKIHELSHGAGCFTGCFDNSGCIVVK